MDTNRASRTVALDFDGVLAIHKPPLTGLDHTGPPTPGGLDFVKGLRRKGYTVVVYTVRHPEHIKRWLRRHNYPALEVTNKKPLAMVYIDDHGFRFTGDWKAAQKAIEEKTWEGM